MDAGSGVDAGSSATTTCSVDVTPETGGAASTFTLAFESNGSACSLTVDGFALGGGSCAGSFSGEGSLVGVGTHVVTLDVSDGPSGPTSCSDTFTVTP